MTLIEKLLDEHRQIERLIALLLKAVDHHEQGQPLQPLFFIHAAQFIRVYNDGIHHRKEEGILFPIIASGMPKAVEALLGEHELGRGFTRGMHQAGRAWRDGNPEAAHEAVSYARQYAALLHDHILHEEGVVYPASSWLATPADRKQMDDVWTDLEIERVNESEILPLLKTLEDLIL